MRIADRVLSRLLGLPPARNGYTVDHGLRIPMRDGVDLRADHYSPQTRDPRGTVLVRTPYGRGFPESALHGRMLAARGYHALIGSVRGTFGSGGAFEPMAQETADGRDTIAWLREQPWFDGRLATVGGSYLGWAQWTLLQDPPPELRTALVYVGPHDFREAVFGTGAFTLGDFLSWSHQIAGQEARGLRRLTARVTARRRLEPGLRDLPLAEAAEPVLRGRAPWYRTWLSHPQGDDPFWGAYRAGAALERVRVPVLLVSGWQDLFLDQTLIQYETLRARGIEVSLTVGPWTHVGTAVSGAGLVENRALAWLDRHLAGPADSMAGPLPADPSDPTNAESLQVRGQSFLEHHPNYHGTTNPTPANHRDPTNPDYPNDHHASRPTPTNPDHPTVAGHPNDHHTSRPTRTDRGRPTVAGHANDRCASGSARASGVAEPGEAPVRVYRTGEKRWHAMAVWPPATAPASFVPDPVGGLSAGDSVEGEISFRYDPADPTPSVGGRVLSGTAGVRDNRRLEARRDVLTFTTAPLAADLDVAGPPMLELALSVDNPHADVFVRLCDVDPRGRSANFSDAMLRLDPGVPAGDVQHLRLALDGCFHRLVVGHRLRLQISGGAHPRFSRNLGTDGTFVDGAKLATSLHTVHTAQTRLVLPISSDVPSTTR
ncbi:CocE/NonD family hydrolase [Actinoplanes sp. NPDC049118]|uniref:CocE/NonD family hydrolase n=1 Tax=Actinoplanes sp. NPDC049118 TaxID=3155769 RepID=UPI00340CFEF8